MMHFGGTPAPADAWAAAPSPGDASAPLPDLEWRHHQIVGFDLETTGTDVENDRIVTASLVVVHRSTLTDCRTWLVNPGVPIPEAASRVHGISTELAAEQGVEPAEALAELAQYLGRAQQHGYPVVSFNAAFDWSMLHRELARHLPGTPLPQPFVIDPYVIDKQVDQYRRGPRTLTAMSEHYRLDTSFAAHDATADSLAAVRLATCIIDGNPKLHTNLGTLHAWQRQWREAQQRSLLDYLERSGKPTDDVFFSWPVKEPA